MNERLIRRYRNWYAKLLRLYSKPYYERFGEEMKQTFTDLLRERAEEGQGLFGYALWLFVETSAGIMRENITYIIMQNKNIICLAFGTAFILLMPLIAMLFTNQVVWDLTDFIVAGTLIFGTGLAYELVARKGGTMAYRVAVGIALAAAFLLVWMNLAVGIIGSEDNPVNLMYFGVLAIGILGATIARLRPQGMARTLFATALAQALVPMIALIIKKPQVTSVEASIGVLGVLGLNAFFVMMFIGSAMLFRRSRIRL
ncbi:hypothetical protein NC996_19140 [Trichocoleus sp. ST-U2]|uniref:hypothetical protein n=2 Tax=Cyanobacteriota TaxID=1117 RepID=UPI0018F04050|nr:hypothetical protein [Coleofasciculus sp. FACHB-SPT9]